MLRELESRSVVWLALCLTLAGCSGAKQEAQPASAAAGDSTKCDAASPVPFSAAHDVVAKRCTSCHSPNGEAGADYDWTNDQALTAHRQNVAAEVAEGGMPPAGSPRLTPEEVRALVCWGKGN